MKKFYTFLVLALSLVACNEAETTTASPESKEEVLTALQEGNARFVEGKVANFHEDHFYAETLAEAQAPFATIVACSDSRVPVELIFDQGFGDLFVIRNAGNTVLDPVSLGSVEYSVNHLGVNTVVVLGHTSCGAITGVVMEEDPHHHVEGDEHVGDLLNHIAEYIPQHKGTNKDLDQAIHDNITVQINALLESENIAKRVKEGSVQIVPAIYDIATGKVKYIIEK